MRVVAEPRLLSRASGRSGLPRGGRSSHGQLTPCGHEPPRSSLDDRRLEVVANGPPLEWSSGSGRYHVGLASLLFRRAPQTRVVTGPPCARPGAEGAHLPGAAPPSGAALSCLPSRSGAGGALKRAASSAASLVRELAPRLPPFSLQSSPLSLPVGTISAEGSPRSRQFARRASERALTRTISAEGTFRKLPSGLPPPEKEEELGVEM